MWFVFFFLFSIMCPEGTFSKHHKPRESLQNKIIVFKSNQPILINMFSEEIAEKILDVAALDIHLLWQRKCHRFLLLY